MERGDGERDVCGPVMKLERVDAAVRPIAHRIVLHRHDEADEDVEREQRHRHKAEVAREIYCRHRMESRIKKNAGGGSAGILTFWLVNPLRLQSRKRI